MIPTETERWRREISPYSSVYVALILARSAHPKEGEPPNLEACNVIKAHVVYISTLKNQLYLKCRKILLSFHSHVKTEAQGTSVEESLIGG